LEILIGDRREKASMVKLQTVLSVLLVLLLLPLAPVLAADKVAPAGLEALIDEALRNNPELKAEEQKLDAYSEKPSQEESLDNPRLALGLFNLPVNTFSFEQEPMTQKQVAIMQKIPFPGKLPLKGEIARKDAEVVREQVEEERSKLIMQVKTVYRNLLLINKTISVTRRNRDLLREFVKTAETKYSVGMGIQQDVLKARVELSRMIDMLITQEQKKESLAARLNFLLYRPPDAKAPDIEGQDIETLKPTPFDYSVTELEKMAVESRPILVAARQRVEKSQLAVRLAKKSYFPDFDVFVSYGQRENRPDFVSGSVVVSIPLWHRTKEDRKVAEERANVGQAEEQYNSLKNDIFFRLKNAALEIKRYGEQIDLYKTGLIPQGRAALESAIAEYGVNKVDFVTLINNQITFYNYEIDYYVVLTDYENTIAEVEATVGKRLF
jgi:cobalt-zinc-cadmium efflux system outer membrane protein